MRNLYFNQKRYEILKVPDNDSIAKSRWQFLRHLRLLLWKNFIIKKRSLVSQGFSKKFNQNLNQIFYFMM